MSALGPISAALEGELRQRVQQNGKEAIRRMGRRDNRQVVNEMRLLEPGLWSVIPEEVAKMERRLSDKQGSLFSLRAPDEAEGRAGTGEQSVQVGLFGAPGTSQPGSMEVRGTPSC